MPRFTPDPSKASAGIPIYPKGRYQVELGEPKPFYKTASQSDKQDNYGVRFPGKIVEADDSQFVGKNYIVNIYQHTQPSMDMGKQIQMAALGYNPKDRDAEAKFNDEVGHLDWGFDTDEGSVGEGWQRMKGQVVVFDLDVTISGERGEQQKVVGISSL